MKQILVPLCLLISALPLFAQNTTTISGSSIMDLNGTKLATGQICFLGTDNTDMPISFQQGGGGQVLKRQFCSSVTAGVITSFSVPNPAATLPSGIYYRVIVKDTSNGVEVLRYTGVTFSGGTFNFDNYTPALAGASFAPLTGTSVSGNLGVTGNIAATGSVTGSNIPANILQQIFNQGVGLTQRTALNCLAGIVCSDNAGTARTDVRLGTLTTVTFSATPTFDASTASTFKITLTGNVTGSTLSNPVAGQPIAMEICQDAIGGHTFVAPTNVVGFVAIPSAANACILETFVYDGANALADQDVAGQLKGPEAAAPAGVASFDLLYADSTAHRWKMINNNGTADTVAGLADFAAPPAIGNTTPNTGAFTAVNKVTITTPATGSTLTIANGKTLTANNSLTFAGTDGTTQTFQASDTIVGRATTDTLSNKTLTSATLTSPIVNTGIAHGGSGFMHVRAASCITAASVGATCTTTITWPGTWADTNYTAICSLDTSTNVPVLIATGGKSTTQIGVVIYALTAAAAAATFNCIGVHD
jgi:hypothetical protein